MPCQEHVALFVKSFHEVQYAIKLLLTNVLLTQASWIKEHS